LCDVPGIGFGYLAQARLFPLEGFPLEFVKPARAIISSESCKVIHAHIASILQSETPTAGLVMGLFSIKEVLRRLQSRMLSGQCESIETPAGELLSYRLVCSVQLGEIPYG
jgi:hypothetical protein